MIIKKLAIDIQDYAKKYVELPFEHHQARMRRERVIIAAEKLEASKGHVIEVGCGMQPLFLDLKNYKKMTVALTTGEVSL